MDFLLSNEHTLVVNELKGRIGVFDFSTSLTHRLIESDDWIRFTVFYCASRESLSWHADSIQEWIVQFASCTRVECIWRDNCDLRAPRKIELIRDAIIFFCHRNVRFLAQEARRSILRSRWYPAMRCISTGEAWLSI